MRIALLQFYSKTPTPVYSELARVFRGWGHTVWVGTPDENGDLLWDDGASAFHRTRGPRRGRNRFLRPLVSRLAQVAFMLRVRKDLKRLRPDIAQINKTAYAGILPVSMPGGIRFIYDVRQPGLWGPETAKGRAANRRIVRRLRRNSRKGFHIACYASEEAALRILGPAWRGWAVITPIGVDRQFLDFQHKNVHAPRADGKIRFIYVGSLLIGKHLEQLLAAAEELARTTDKFELVLMGPGDGVEHYRDLVNQRSLQHYVRFLPPVPYNDVPAIVAGFDVAVAFVPAIEDWQYQVTLKVLEYRALGMPILASDLPPNRSIVFDGKNGVLAPNAPVDFARGMKRFIDDPSFLAGARREALALRGGRTWEDVARTYIDDVFGRVLCPS